MQKILTSALTLLFITPAFATLSVQANTNAITVTTKPQPTALQVRENAVQQVSKNPFGISLFQPNYMLPFYYTVSPDNQVYAGTTPDNQRVESQEFKAQISFEIPLWHKILGSKYNLNMAYTQLMYWQFYVKSQYFRETNYEPQIFISRPIDQHWTGNLGIVHQSNGRGGEYERSWNRIYLNAIYSYSNWAVSIKPWVLIFKNYSSNADNPTIAKYLGHERTVVAYKFGNQEASLMLRNNLESGFSRGAIRAAYSFPIHGKLHGYLQFFSGYGQSLIEYNHYTNAFGIGISVNNWI